MAWNNGNEIKFVQAIGGQPSPALWSETFPQPKEASFKLSGPSTGKKKKLLKLEEASLNSTLLVQWADPPQCLPEKS